MLFTWAIALLYAVYMGYRLTKMDRFSKWSHFSNYLVYLHATFASGFLHITTLIAFLQIHFRHIFEEEKFLTHTSPFCMGYRLTKMVDSSKWSHFSNIWLFFLGGFFHKTTLNAFLQIHFRHIFARKKFLTHNLPILHGLQTYQNGESSKCSNISTIWCFCTQFFAQKNSLHSVESFQAFFCQQKIEIILPIFHGLQTYHNARSSKCSHISTIWCFCRRFLKQQF